MKRLVKNGKIILDGTDPLYVKEEQALRKLEELENIEEELGIDLIIFFNNYRELLSLKGRNLKISIEEMQKELERL